MKRILLALTMLIGFSAAAQMAKADVSVDFFYNNLNGGNWVEVGDYGYCWQPDVAVNNNDWRPYADGYWAYTDEGWTWVSYEDFGWATYHYGRWARLADEGWVWVPGRNEDLEWGPAWVSWRTGDQYVGWAPLPPNGERIYEGRDITGHVDVDYDIGPSYYNFVDVRYIGDPVLRERLIAPQQNYTYINQTVNVTNITYKNKTVYNYGPDINVINQRSSRPIQRLTIQRDNNADFTAAARSGNLKTKVQGQSLIVAAPTHITKSERQVAPPNVKTRIARANLDTGWAGVGDASAKERYKQKLRSEDSSKISRGAGATGQAAVGASPSGASTSAQVGTAPASGVPATSAGVSTQGGKNGKHNRNRSEQPVQQNAPTASSPAGETSNTNVNSSIGAERGNGGKHKNRQAEPNAVKTTAPSPVNAAPATEASAPAAGKADLNGEGRGKHQGRRVEQSQPVSAGATGGTTAPTPAARTESSAAVEPVVQGGGRHNRRNQEASGAEGQLQGQPATGVPAEPNRGQEGRKARRMEEQNPSVPNGATNPELQGQGGGRRREQVPPQGAVAPSQPGVTQGEPQGQGRQEGERKKNKIEASPVPSPQ